MEYWQVCELDIVLGIWVNLVDPLQLFSAAIF